MAGPTILDEMKIALGTQRGAGSTFGANNIKVHLWQGGTSPDHTDTIGTLLALDCTFAGYTVQSVAAWGLPVLTAAFKDVFLGSPVTFTNSSGGPTPNIIGFWYEAVAEVKALLVGKFPVPIVIPAGESFTFTPSWEGTGENLST